MHYVYILESKKNYSLYIGYTRNLKSRVNKHNCGEVSSTKAKAPYKLIHYEMYLNKKDALEREDYLKSGYGRRSINKMLSNYFKNKQ